MNRLFTRLLLTACLVFSFAVVGNAQLGTDDPMGDQHGTLRGLGAPAASLCHNRTRGQIYVDATAAVSYTCGADLTWHQAVAGGAPTPTAVQSALGPYVTTVNGASGPVTITGISPLDISIASACGTSGAQADLNTGLTPAGGAAGDYGPCITTQAALAVQKGVGLKIDGTFKVSGVSLPYGGGVKLYGLGGGMNRVKITAWSITGNVATFTAANTLAVNNTVILGLFGSSTFFNASAVKVLSASATQFTANFTHANGSATETGEADYLTGTGLIAAAGTNNDLIHNGSYGSACYTDPGTATPGLAPGRGSGLIVTDMVLNGWGGTLTGANGNSTSGTRQANFLNYTGPYTETGCEYNDLNIRDLEDVRIDNVYFFNAPAHELDLSNVGHAQVTNSGFETWYPNQPLISTDGIHVNGPSNNIAIANISCRVGECIALNSPEGWSGVISATSINGVEDDGSNSILRLYAGSVAPPAGTAVAGIDGLVATNLVSRTPSIIPIIIGVETTRSALTVPEAVRNIKIANSYIQGPYAVTLADNIGGVEFANVSWAQTSCLGSNGFFASTVNASTGTSLTAINIKALRTSAGGNCVAGILNTSAGGYPGAATPLTLGTFTVNGFGIGDVAGVSNGATSALMVLGGGSSVGQWNRSNIDWNNITNPSSGAGLAATQSAPQVNDGPSTQAMLRYRGGGGTPVNDQNLWDCLTNNTAYVCRTINDANTAANSWLLVNRSGYVPSSITLGASTIFNDLFSGGNRVGLSFQHNGVGQFQIGADIAQNGGQDIYLFHNNSTAGNTVPLSFSGTDAATFLKSVTAGTYFQEPLTTPASSTAACVAGQFGDDANYHYVCTAANTWKRVALAAF